MPETVLGIPAHPLLIHAAIVFVPLLIIGTIGYALAPRLRARVGWAVATLAIIAPISALFAKLSGDAFRARLVRLHLSSADLLQKIDNHRQYGTMTLYLVTALSVVALVMVLLPLVRQGPLGYACCLVITIGLGMATGYYIFRTGDTGAHVVWQGF